MFTHKVHEVMNRLIIVRHGKSAYPAGVEDWSRPLADRGRREVPAVGQALAALIHGPVMALVSGARRTRDTWHLLNPWIKSAHVEYVDSLYEASASEVMSVITQRSRVSPQIMVVGHNPGLEEAVSILTGRSARLPTSTAYVLGSGDGREWEVAAYLRGRFLPTPTDAP